MTKEEFDKLDKCHIQFNIQERCESETLEARALLGCYRFDLYPILTYIDHRVKGVRDMTYAVNLYKARTHAVTNGKLSEVGNDKKNTFDDYLSVLDALIYDFQNDQYDINKTLIPVDKDYVLMDGAHRVSCAAYFGKKVRILRFLDRETYKITSRMLQTKFVPEQLLDYMALESVKWHDDLFMLFLWPKSFEQPDVQKKCIELIYKRTDVMHEKVSKLNYLAIRNLMLQIYAHMDWIGCVDDDFSNIYAKADEVWSNNRKCCFLLVKAPSTQYILELKKEIREMFGIGLASMHSTDNIHETTIAVNSLYNPLSMNFLLTAEPVKYKDTYRAFEKVMREHSNLQDAVIGPDLALAIWGMGVIENVQMIKDSIDICTIPVNYFTFHNKKILSPQKLVDYYTMEFDTRKDKNTLKKLKMSKSLSRSQDIRLQLRMSSVKADIHRIGRKSKELLILKTISVLKFLRVYSMVRIIWNTIKER